MIAALRELMNLGPNDPAPVPPPLPPAADDKKADEKDEESSTADEKKEEEKKPDTVAQGDQVQPGTTAR